MNNIFEIKGHILKRDIIQWLKNVFIKDLKLLWNAQFKSVVILNNFVSRKMIYKMITVSFEDLDKLNFVMLGWL
jgi:hypothetical protein